MDRKQEDEIGLWTIEKRVSFSVSGVSERRGSSSEVVRDTDGGKVVGTHSQVDILGEDKLRERERERERGDGFADGELGAGRVTTVIDGGQNNRSRNESRNHHRGSG